MPFVSSTITSQTVSFPLMAQQQTNQNLKNAASAYVRRLTTTLSSFQAVANAALLEGTTVRFAKDVAEAAGVFSPQSDSRVPQPFPSISQIMRNYAQLQQYELVVRQASRDESVELNAKQTVALLTAACQLLLIMKDAFAQGPDNLQGPTYTFSDPNQGRDQNETTIVVASDYLDILALDGGASRIVENFKTGLDIVLMQPVHAMIVALARIDVRSTDLVQEIKKNQQHFLRAVDAIVKVQGLQFSDTIFGITDLQTGRPSEKATADASRVTPSLTDPSVVVSSFANLLADSLTSSPTATFMSDNYYENIESSDYASMFAERSSLFADVLVDLQVVAVHRGVAVIDGKITGPERQQQSQEQLYKDTLSDSLAINKLFIDIQDKLSQKRGQISPDQVVQDAIRTAASNFTIKNKVVEPQQSTYAIALGLLTVLLGETNKENVDSSRLAIFTFFHGIHLKPHVQPLLVLDEQDQRLISRYLADTASAEILNKITPADIDNSSSGDPNPQRRQLAKTLTLYVSNASRKKLRKAGGSTWYDARRYTIAAALSVPSSSQGKPLINDIVRIMLDIALLPMNFTLANDSVQGRLITSQLAIGEDIDPTDFPSDQLLAVVQFAGALLLALFVANLYNRPSRTTTEEENENELVLNETQVVQEVKSNSSRLLERFEELSKKLTESISTYNAYVQQQQGQGLIAAEIQRITSNITRFYKNNDNDALFAAYTQANALLRQLPDRNQLDPDENHANLTTAFLRNTSTPSSSRKGKEEEEEEEGTSSQDKALSQRDRVLLLKQFMGSLNLFPPKSTLGSQADYCLSNDSKPQQQQKSPIILSRRRC